MLAQIAREGLVRDIVAHLTADFAQRLNQHLSGVQPEGLTEGSQNLNGVSLLIDLLRTRVRKALRRLFRR